MNRNELLKWSEKLSKTITLKDISQIGHFSVFNFLQCINLAKVYDKKEIKNILLYHIQDEKIKKMINVFEHTSKNVYPDDYKLFFKLNEIIDKLVFEACNLKNSSLDELMKKDFFS